MTEIGDDIAVSKMIDWLTDYPRLASNLFDESLFDELGYEIDRRGRRRDLLLGYKILLAEAPPPSSGIRRSEIEVFRPVGGRCQECGSRMLALLDVRVDSRVYARQCARWTMRRTRIVGP